MEKYVGTGLAFGMQVGGGTWAWGRLTERDSGGGGLSAIGPRGGHAWRSAMRAASQLSGRGPAGVDVDSVPAL